MENVSQLMAWLDSKELYLVYIGRYKRGHWSVCFQVREGPEEKVHEVHDITFATAVHKAACLIEHMGI